MSDQNKNLKMTSNVSPPTELPSFLIPQTKDEEKEPESKFSPAIPMEKNYISTNDEDKNKEAAAEEDSSVIPLQDIAQALSPLTEGVKNSVFYGFIKDSFKSGMDIAKDSMHKVVTTLDPQMSGILYSGGDIEVVVASSNEDKIEPVRQSFQTVFKKATVIGKQSQAKTMALQPVGFENAELSAKERINTLRSHELLVDKVILSVENFLFEAYKNQWFDVGLLLLSDPQNNITLKTFTQMTPIDFEVIQVLQSETPQDYDKRDTGFSITIGNIMAQNLNVPHFEWHKTYTSIDRFDMILNAATSLASIYKLKLQSKPVKNTTDEK